MRAGESTRSPADRSPREHGRNHSFFNALIGRFGVVDTKRSPIGTASVAGSSGWSLIRGDVRSWSPLVAVSRASDACHRLLIRAAYLTPPRDRNMKVGPGTRKGGVRDAG